MYHDNWLYIPLPSFLRLIIMYAMSPINMAHSTDNTTIKPIHSPRSDDLLYPALGA